MKILCASYKHLRKQRKPLNGAKLYSAIWHKSISKMVDKNTNLNFNPIVGNKIFSETETINDLTISVQDIPISENENLSSEDNISICYTSLENEDDTARNDGVSEAAAHNMDEQTGLLQNSQHKRPLPPRPTPEFMNINNNHNSTLKGRAGSSNRAIKNKKRLSTFKFSRL